MIIMMLDLYSTIHVGDTIYYSVSRPTWLCYQLFFRWVYEQRLGTPLMFQGGWSVGVSDA